MQNEIKIDTPFITLSQLLKLTNEFESGGFIKHYLLETGVDINGEHEHRRGKKLYHGDVITLANDKKYIVKQLNDV